MSEETLTLHDIAARIVQIEPTDLAGLAYVRKALSTAAASSPIPVQNPIAEAIKKIDLLIGGTTLDPSGLFAKIGFLVEEAIEAMEKSVEEEQLSMGSEPERASTEARQPEAARSDTLPLGADRTLLGEFVAESRDLVENAESALLSLETDPENAEAINTVFRSFHTIKGTSAFLGLDHISELAHRAESFLTPIRDKETRFAGGNADLAFRSVDMLKDLIQIVQDGLDGEPMVTPDGFDDLMLLLVEPEERASYDEPVEANEMSLRLGDILVAQGKADREKIEAAATDQSDQPIGLAIVRSGAASLTEVGRALRKQKSLSGVERAEESSVRVRTDRLDRLVEMVGELVIGHSMVAQDETVNSGNHPDLQEKINNAEKILRQVQDLCMSIRMVPLRTTFHKMARLVRDLARRREIMINFVPIGEDTEIDRNMVDLINDPLVHLVRNAVDHGIEPPEERERNGKPRAGTLSMKAYHSGGNVVLEISDDGRGLDHDKILQKAVAKGLSNSGRTMSESEVLDLIFQPGFSTADTVTDISGRGVGLDVVRKAVETLRGRIDVTSELGKRCIFSLRLPLTMAITDGMLVKVSSQRYILPTINIKMSFRPNGEELSTIVGRGEAVLFQEKVLPIFRLSRLFNVKDAIEDLTKGLLIIVGEGEQRCALFVDELVGQQQVVAKSLGDGIGKIQGISGGAILGDGHVGLILDPQGIAGLARHRFGSGDPVTVQ